MLDFAPKARAWPKIRAKNRAENSPKRRFFNSCRAGKSKNPRACRPFSAKSLSVEQFLCTNFRRTPTFTFFNSYKREEKPYKKGQKALANFAWAISTPTFFSGQIQKARASDSLQIRHLTQKHPQIDPLHLCLPLPPGRIGGGIHVC